MVLTIILKHGFNLKLLLLKIYNRGRIRITKAQSLDTWMVFKVTGAITNASGYTKVTLVYIDSAGKFN